MDQERRVGIVLKIDNGREFWVFFLLGEEEECWPLFSCFGVEEKSGDGT